MTSSHTAGKLNRVVPTKDASIFGIAQDSAVGKTDLVLAAGESAVDGFFSEADIVISGGLDDGVANRFKDYTGGTKTGLVYTIWPSRPLAASAKYKVTTRRTVVEFGDRFKFFCDFTVNGGAAGVDLTMGVIIQYDDDRG